MQPILPKKQMTEEDIKLQYITPALISKWNIKKITMETQITDGQISLKGNLAFRKKPKRVDYMLYLCANHPIAVIEAKDNKTHFVVMDFRNVTRLFADPEWDGPIEQTSDFDPNGPQTIGTPPVSENLPLPSGSNPKPVVDVNGCKVEIIHKTVSIYDTNGKLLRQESIIDYTKENILGEYASLDNFIQKWTAEEKKDKIRNLLRERGIDLEAIKAEQNMTDVDDFDFICHVAFDRKPLTRRERANNVKKRDFLSKYSGAAREVLEALLDKYMNIGIYELEKTEILKLDPFVKMGKPAKIAGYFGGKAGYLQAVKELKDALYENEAG